MHAAPAARRSPLNARAARPQVKPEIIAGLVVEIGDKYLVRESAERTLRPKCRHHSLLLTRPALQDLSLDTRIRKMEQLLQQPL